MRRSLLLLGVFALIVPLLFLGCSGDDGSNGVSVGTISGTVTNSATGTGLAGATVETTPDQGTATTAQDGSYSLTNLPAGVYEVAFKKTDFGTVNRTVSVLAANSTTEDVTLIPTSPVVVSVDVTGTATPGATVTATATPMVLDGSTVQSIVWSQGNSVTVIIDNNTQFTTGVTLPDLAAYKDEMFLVLEEPPITAAQLPPNVTPPASLPEQLPDRFGVVGLNHFELEETGLVTLVATVTTSSGTYTGRGEITTTGLPWKPNPGIANVPVGISVLVHGGTQGGTQTSWDWAVTGPGGAALDSGSAATDQNITFTPGAAGTYTVTESVSGTSLTVVAGTWVGAITGEGPDGFPDAANCTFSVGCHAPTANLNGVPIDMFVTWRETGHAEIFKQNINAGGHYTESCFGCHTVGYDPDVSNNGIDDQSDYDAMIAKYFDDTPGFSAHGSPLPNPDNYADVLASFQNTGRDTNIQCENCHGPNNSSLHFDGVLDPERINLASWVCGACHGEPARHGRYQQWQVSPHSDYELAIEEGTSSSCAPCHSANGFVAWNFADPPFGASAVITVTWNDNTVQPQTCAACHPPHDEGNLSGIPNNAKVRVENDTPVLKAGFRVLDAGRGAICMVCHNTRRGLVNDSNPGDVITTGRAPHAGAQADVLMGQNAFFVEVGIRGKHSLITDTCSNCHMEKTPPPADLSYQLGGTNHTFYASRDICKDCHNSVTADEVQSATENQIAFLKVSMEATLEGMITAYAQTDNVTLVGAQDNTTIAPTDNVTVTNYSDSHGSQAADITVNGVTETIQLQDILVNTDFNIITFNGNGNDGPGEILAKCGWNYLMATNERSHGIHNPTFSLQILAGAQNAVDAIVF